MGIKARRDEGRAIRTLCSPRGCPGLELLRWIGPLMVGPESCVGATGAPAAGCCSEERKKKLYTSEIVDKRIFILCCSRVLLF